MNVRMWEHEATQRNVQLLKKAGVRVMQPEEGEMACGEFGAGRLPEPELVWLEIADALGLDPGEAGAQDIAEYLEALEPEEEPDGEEAHSRFGGLGAVLASIIPRSTPRRIAEDEVVYDDAQFAALAIDEEAVLAEPDLSSPILARKGAAKAAPPTDAEALNHEVNPNQVAPEPVAPAVPAPVAELEVHEAAPEQVFVADPASDPKKGPLKGKHVLVTAGPTHEALDPVRYIANRSSGKQGFAIAAAAAAAGAKVTLVSGPVHLETPRGVKRVDVESAEQMAKAVKSALPADVGIFVAAVADWRTREYLPYKLKKRGDAPPALLLTENPDILVSIAGDKKRPKLLIGFAAETDDLLANARKKRKNKGADWIVANDVSGPIGESVMGGADNQVTLIKEGGEETWEPMSKIDVAKQLVQRIVDEIA
jgi:phosphopantothenoylcysteine decarboxylase/phosphopantothenate--cysteine ligase